jgi:endonuclease/exonuclease/phosphatase family metal-dependent hydrolase
MGDDGSEQPWPAWVHTAASVVLGLLLVAVPLAVVGYGHLSDGGDDPGQGQVVPGGPSTSGPTDETPSAPSWSPTPEPLPSASGETCVPENTTGLTVVSFNIKSGHGANGTVQLDLLASTLASWKPDLVLLQEVDKNQVRTGRVDQPAYLGEKLGFYSTFGANMANGSGGQYGTALLSRYPILSVENTRLPRLPGDEPRGLLHAVLDVDDTSLSAYVVHLQHTSATARLSQMATIQRIVTADPLPKIVGGDFNTTPGSAVMGVARSFASDTWTAVGTGPGLTVPRVAPRRRIDYLLQTGLVPQDMRVLTPPVSDHRALWARLALDASGKVCLPDFGSGKRKP